MLTKENNQQEAYVNACVVPGRCIRSRGFLGRGTTVRSWGWLHCRSSLADQVQFIYPWQKWPDYCRQLDFASTHVHILHSIVLVACKGGCSLHSMGSWCRQRPLRNSSRRHTGRCHQQTQYHLHILYRDTCSLQANNWKHKFGEMAPTRKCMISGSSPGCLLLLGSNLTLAGHAALPLHWVLAVGGRTAFPVTPNRALTTNTSHTRIWRVIPHFPVRSLSALVKAAYEARACGHLMQPVSQSVLSCLQSRKKWIVPSQVRQHSCRMGCEHAAKRQGLRWQWTAPSVQAHDWQLSEGW